MEQDKEKGRHVFFLPVYAAGHLIPMVEAAKRLLQLHSNYNSSSAATFLIMHPPSSSTTSPISSSYIHSISTSSQHQLIRFHHLPPVDPPSSFDSPEEFNSLYTQLHLPHIKSAILASPSPPSALVLDLFSTAAIDVAKDLHIPSYIYFTSTLTFLALMLYLPTLSQPGTDFDFWDTDHEELRVPGITPLPALSVPKPLMTSKLNSFRWFVHHARRYTEADGIIVNSSAHLEPKAMDALAAVAAPQVFPVGPIIYFGEEDHGSKEQHACLKWLDKQPAKSVVFLCFGSRGAFDPDQVMRLSELIY